MADEKLRQSQRERALDPEGEVRWLSERQRSGALERERLELAAYLGHVGAQELIPGAEPAPDEGDAYGEWLMGLARWGPGCLVRAGLALLGEIPLRSYGSNRFDGPDDRLLAAHERLAQWAADPSAISLEALQAVQAELTEANYGYGMLAAINCAFALLRIPAEPELAASLLRDACTNALQRVRLDSAHKALRRELLPWALGESDPLQRVLGGRGARWLRLDGLNRGLVWDDPHRVWTATSTGDIAAYDLDGELVLELPQRSRDVYAFAGGPGGQLVVGELGGACEWWADPTQPGVPFTLKGDPRAFAFTRDGQWLWAGTHSGEVVGFDLARDLQRVGVSVAEQAVNALCVVGNEVWAGARGGWLVGLGASGRELKRIGPLPHDVEALAALPDGRLVVGCERSVACYDLERGVELTRLEPHASRVHQVVAVPGWNQVVSVSGDRDVVWRDLDSGETLRRWETPSVLLSCAVSPDGRTALSGARTGLIRRHELRR